MTKKLNSKTELKLIEKYADKWCRDNDYPIRRKKYVYKNRTWIKVLGENLVKLK